MDALISEAIDAFWPTGQLPSVDLLSDGLVHQTALIEVGGSQFVLQKINTCVFEEPDLITKNMELVTGHLLQHKLYALEVPQLIPWSSGQKLFTDSAGNQWRCFRFIEHAEVNDQIDAETSYVVAKAFGCFDDALINLDPEHLFITIPNFHSPEFRLRQFKEALREPAISIGSDERALISDLQDHENVAAKWLETQLPKRIAHNDAKPSNILFDQSRNPIAIIDLDTVMPGSPLFDFADLVRSMSNSISEDAEVSEDLYFDRAIYDALVRGFLDGFHNIKSIERQYLPLSAAYLIYEQCLRFMTDHLCGNIYYRVEHERHNLIRAQNQMALLQSFLAQDVI